MLELTNTYLTSSFRPSLDASMLKANLSKFNNINVNSSFEHSIFNDYYSNFQPQGTQTFLSLELSNLNKELENFRASSTSYVQQPESSLSTLSKKLEEIKKELAEFKKGCVQQNVSSTVQPTVQPVTHVESPVSITTNSSLNDKLLAAGYDKETSENLAKQSVAQAAGRTSSTGWCAKYVNNAIEAAGLVEKNSTRRESAYQLVEAYKNSGAFTQVKVSKDELKDLPAGCIIVWQPGKGFGNGFANHGHVVITQGNNKATSDYTQEIKDYGTEFTVFVPKKK